MASIDTKRRVKYYVLNDARQWVDRGTGHVSWVYNDRQRSVSLIVKSEIDGSILLEAKILLTIVYQRQQDTLIVWSDPDKRDLALSFQEKAGCDEIWEKICEVLGEDPSTSITSSRGSGSGSGANGSDNLDESDEDQLENDYNTSPTSDLPICELSKLKDIRDFFVCELPRKSKAYKEKLTTILESDSYIKKLIELFQMCEDLENIEGLNYLFEIFRCLFYLNKSSLLDILLSDDLIMDVIGCLEYDPSKTEPIKHREYINTKSQFKEIIPFENIDLVNKIHQTYKVQYIQDVILPAPSVFEENSLASLTSFIFLNKVEISNLIQDDDRFLNELFENLKSPDLELDKRRDMILFLREFIGFLHSLQQTREPYFRSLNEHGILSVLEASLNVKDERINTTAIDILSQFVEVSPTLVREFILNEIESKSSVNYLNTSLNKLSNSENILNNSNNNNNNYNKQMPSTPISQFNTSQSSSQDISNTPTCSLVQQTSILSTSSSEQIEKSANIEQQIANKSHNSTATLSLADILNTDEVFEPILINFVIRQMINDPDPELSGAMQIINLLKLLIDPENMLSAANKAEKSEFLAYFYRKSMCILITPLLANTSNGQINREDYRIAQLQNLILDFLSFCVEHHTFHIKNYIINRDLLKRILVLLKSKHQFLALSALRFLRKTISLKEETYNKYIIKANLFEPVVEALKTNASRYNILNSAIIELFDFIRLDDVKSLMTYIVENFYTDLENFNYVRTFKDLKMRYDQHKEKLNETASNRLRLNSEGTPSLYRTRTSSDRYRAQDRIDFDKDDEAWIEEDDEELESRIESNSNLAASLENHLTSSSSSNSSSSSSNSNPNSNSNDDVPINENNNSNSELTLGNSQFLEYKKSNQLDMDENEDTIFSPVKSNLSPNSNSNSSSNSSCSNGGFNQTSSNKMINIKISSSTAIALKQSLNSQDNFNSKNESDNQNSNSNSPTATNAHSPSLSAKKQTLVDYEYDSDEEEEKDDDVENQSESNNKSNDSTPNKENMNDESKSPNKKALEETSETVINKNNNNNNSSNNTNLVIQESNNFNQNHIDEIVNETNTNGNDIDNINIQHQDSTSTAMNEDIDESNKNSIINKNINNNETCVNLTINNEPEQKHQINDITNTDISSLSNNSKEDSKKIDNETGINNNNEYINNNSHNHVTYKNHINQKNNIESNDIQDNDNKTNHNNKNNNVEDEDEITESNEKLQQDQQTTNEIISKSKSSLSPLGGLGSIEPANKRARLSNS